MSLLIVLYVLRTTGSFLKKRIKETTERPDSQVQERLSNLASGRDEMNLCEVPFATLSERASSKNMIRVEFEYSSRELQQTVKRTLTVKGDPEFGLPTAKDEEIYLALLKYTHDFNAFRRPVVHFSRAALFELMGWRKSDWAYSRLTLGMHRLVGVRLSFKNLWRDNRNKQWRDQGAFGILDSFKFTDSRRLTREEPFSEQRSLFRWSGVLFESFDSGYLKRIDYSLARSLSVPARRLYRYLDKHFHPPGRMCLEMDLARLAYVHIGISENTELDKVRKRYLIPAAEELESAGYLEAAPAEERFVRLQPGKWLGRFTLRQQAGSAPVRSEPPEIVAALCQRGLSRRSAVRLVQRYGHQVLWPAVIAFDEQRQKGVTIRSAERWFVAAAERGFAASPEFRQTASRPERRVYRAKSR